MKALLSVASLFEITVKEYQNIKFDQSDAATVRLVIFGLCIGAVLASLLTLYQRNVPGGFVRALLAAGALSPEGAKALSELGYEKNALVKFELKHNTVLQKTVLTLTAADGTARYYIPEEQKYRAETRFESKGNGPLQFALTVVLAIGLAILLLKLIPPVLSMIDAIL